MELKSEGQKKKKKRVKVREKRGPSTAVILNQGVGGGGFHPRGGMGTPPPPVAYQNIRGEQQ